MPPQPVDICLTLDLDWARDDVLRDALALLDEIGLPVTLFCTNPSPRLEELDRKRFELAWHPNFLSGRAADEVLDELAGWFPGAGGMRAHALYFHSRLVPLCLERGIRYLGHDLCFLQQGLRPRTHWSGLVDVPGFWEDDVHALYFDGAFSLDQLELERPGLKVFDFHPIHLALNTDRMARYEAAREDIEAGRPLAPHVNPGAGSRTLLLELAARIHAEPARYRPRTMAEVAAEHERDNPYRGRFGAAD